MNKPKDFLSSLGPSVDMSTENVDHSPRQDEMLRDLGKMVAENISAQGLEYQGSFAIHLFRSPDGKGELAGKYDMASVTQIAINEGCSEQMCTLGFNNAVLQLQRYFHPGKGTGRRGDKR